MICASWYTVFNVELERGIPSLITSEKKLLTQKNYWAWETWHHQQTTKSKEPMTTPLSKPRLSSMLRTFGAPSINQQSDVFIKLYNRVEEKRERLKQENIEKSSLTWKFIKARVKGTWIWSTLKYACTQTVYIHSSKEFTRGEEWTSLCTLPDWSCWKAWNRLSECASGRSPVLHCMQQRFKEEKAIGCAKDNVRRHILSLMTDSPHPYIWLMIDHTVKN